MFTVEELKKMKIEQERKIYSIKREIVHQNNDISLLKKQAVELEKFRKDNQKELEALEILSGKIEKMISQEEFYTEYEE